MGLLSVRFIKYFKFPSYGHFSISSKGGEGQRICFDQNTVSMSTIYQLRVGALKQRSARVFSKTTDVYLGSVSLVVAVTAIQLCTTVWKQPEITCNQMGVAMFSKNFQTEIWNPYNFCVPPKCDSFFLSNWRYGLKYTYLPTSGIYKNRWQVRFDPKAILYQSLPQKNWWVIPWWLRG